jgi:hypothetical protein
MIIGHFALVLIERNFLWKVLKVNEDFDKIAIPKPGRLYVHQTKKFSFRRTLCNKLSNKPSWFLGEILLLNHKDSALAKPRRFSIRHPLHHKLSNKPSWFLGKTAFAQPRDPLRPPNQEGFHSVFFYSTRS